jgi:iron complex outermembrane receptor protein
MRKDRIALAVAVVCSCSNLVFAEEQTLKEVVITASPVIESNQIDGFSSYSTSVSSEQIKDLGALDLAAGLRMTPGVQISRYNEVGSYNGNAGGAVHIRGMGASRPGSEIKTYLDGVPLYMGIWNHPLMDLLPINGIQSIDVYKSAQPQVNGNNFGSINLTSKRANLEGVVGESNFSAGSFSTRTANANLVGKKDDVDYSIAAGYISSAGDRSNSDGNLKNAMGRIGMKINSSWSSTASFLSVNNEVGDPGDSRYAISSTNGIARNTSSAQLLTASIAHDHENWKGEFKVFTTQGKNNLTDDPTWGTFNTNFKITGFKWKEEFVPWNNAQIIAGIDQDDISGDIYGSKVGGTVGNLNGYTFISGTADLPSFKIISTYIGVNQKFNISEQWLFQPSTGVRYYYSNHYDAKASPHAGFQFISSNITVFGNYVQAYLYPGAETYALTRAMPNFFYADGSNGWNSINPTQDNHSEIGLSWDITNKSKLDVSVFSDEIKDRYIYTVSYSAADGLWSNSSSNYRISGLELSAKHEISNLWKIFAGFTYLDSSLSTVPFIPKTSFTVGVNGQVDNYKISLDAQTQSSMYSTSQDRSSTYAPTYVDGFTVANIRVARQLETLGKNSEMYLMVNNLFDKSYAYTTGYTMPGRNARIGLITRF